MCISGSLLYVIESVECVESAVGVSCVCVGEALILDVDFKLLVVLEVVY